MSAFVSTTLYNYQPLPRKGFIRLLQIHPSEDIDAPITCSLLARQLNDEISSYTALSYSWARGYHDRDLGRYGRHSAPPLCREILVDDQGLQVTENLFDALRRLRTTRYEVGNPCLWVDAVCIHQSDIEERNEQVAMMADIYAKASCTCVWLGEDTDSQEDAMAKEILDAAEEPSSSRDRNTALELVQRPRPVNILSAPRSESRNKFSSGVRGPRLSHNLAARHAWSIEDPNTFLELLQRTRSFNNSQEGFRRSAKPGMIQVFWLKALCKFYQRRYLFRRWILQEIHRSRPGAITVRWAGNTMTLAAFVGRTRVLIRVLSTKMYPGQDALYHKEINHYLEAVGWGVKQALRALSIGDETSLRAAGIEKPKNTLQWLRTVQDSECADPRDRLFALARMSGVGPMASPDYSLDTSAAYTLFAGELARYGWADIILELAIRQRCPGRQAEPWLFDDVCKALQSWVPDFRRMLPSEDDFVNLDSRSRNHVGNTVPSHSTLGTGLHVNAVLGEIREVSQEKTRLNFCGDAEIRRDLTLNALFPSDMGIDSPESDSGKCRPGDIFCVMGSYFVLRPIKDHPHCFRLVGQYRETCFPEIDSAEEGRQDVWIY